MKETMLKELHQHLNYLFSPASCIRRSLILILAIIHEFTKYHTAQTITELFYWPEGVCHDMFVTGSFLIAGIWCIYQDARYFMTYKNAENR